MKHSEFRQNPATKEWVVIAPERPIVAPVKVETGPIHDPLCPFCPGNERMTPIDLLRIPHGPHNSDWQVRVIPDKFAVLTPDIPPLKKDGFFRALTGYGHHEIVIEHPGHNMELSDMPAEHILEVLKVYRTRQRELSHDKNVRFVTIFRNHGSLAGATFSHPHSQILATAIVPEYMHRKHEIAKSYSGSTQRNLYSEIWEAECSGKRMVEADETMAVFVPFAASVPYEMWIMSREPHPCFSMAKDGDLEGLAGALQRSLRRLRNCCGDVAFSYVIYSAAVGEQGPYYQWHLQITPRLVWPTGMELGPHISVNPMLPEECARRLREAPCDVVKKQMLAAG
ncbi:MAG: galactose-1-phosphate uridylyltransferase [Candidatus Angelobacter sp.]